MCLENCGWVVMGSSQTLAANPEGLQSMRDSCLPWCPLDTSAGVSGFPSAQCWGHWQEWQQLVGPWFRPLPVLFKPRLNRELHYSESFQTHSWPRLALCFDSLSQLSLTLDPSTSRIVSPMQLGIVPCLSFRSQCNQLVVSFVHDRRE